MDNERVYIQNKVDGRVWEGEISDSDRKSQQWNMRHRRVRLLHHPESDCVFCEDYDTPEWQSSMCDGMVHEVDIEQWLWLKTLYENPDL